METAEKILPHVNASLNALATVLLVTGYVLIKRGREAAHKWTMLSCFAVSVFFLGCYLYYHIVVKQGESTRFPDYPPDAVRYVYLTILFSHIILAALVPILALVTIFFGFRDQRIWHRRFARWTFPIWLYVSITGVLVYLLLYQVYPPREVGYIIQVSRSWC